MDKDVERVLLSEKQLSEIVERLGAQISRDYAGKELLLVGILKGSVVFMGDLMRAITVPCRIDFMAASSYGAGTVSAGTVQIKKDLDTENIEGRHLLLVEDILDTGNTLNSVKEILAARNPASIKICALLDKPERRRVNLKAEYAGAEIPDAFVVGYGLDYNEQYRTLPYIGILKPSVYGG